MRDIQEVPLLSDFLWGQIGRICEEHELIEVPDLIPEEDTVLHGISLDET